ncbi:hypothetical protein TNCV_894851 [Trichonephila clavipes]|nr:hypothetical protein TNCV_894851 [Trichonephila clavipes]
MLEKVIENWTSRLDYIRASRGSHMPEIILKITAALDGAFQQLMICRIGKQTRIKSVEASHVGIMWSFADGVSQFRCPVTWPRFKTSKFVANNTRVASERNANK